MPSRIIVGMRSRATSVRITHCRDNRKRYTPRRYLPGRGVPWAGGALLSGRGGSDPVHDAGLPFRAGAVRTAEPVALDLHTLPDDLHTTVLADRCHPVDRA